MIWCAAIAGFALGCAAGYAARAVTMPGRREWREGHALGYDAGKARGYRDGHTAGVVYGFTRALCHFRAENAEKTKEGKGR